MSSANKPSNINKYLDFKFFIVLILGFASGLPLLLTGSTLKTWLSRENVDISTIGYFSWVGMAYSLKFVWSPLIDHYSFLKIGRRKSWLFLSQVGLILSLASFQFLSPQSDLSLIALVAVVVAFFSATQDVVIDAYRREILDSSQLGLGSTFSIYGYRVAMLVSGGLAISLVGGSFINLTWNQMYLLMSAIMAGCLVVSFFVPEPKNEFTPPSTLFESIKNPIIEFLKRDQVWLILLFVILFKLGDQLSGALLNPLYVAVGYSNADIGLIAKTFGLASSLVGLFLGGLIIIKLGIYKSLWIFGVLQALSTASFALLTYTGPATWSLAFTVVFEDVSSGMGTAAFVAFLAALTNKKFTATQYALLSSFAALGRNFFSGFSGDLQKILGWEHFFYICALAAIPGLLMLRYMRKKVESTI
jgi:PAT family beta-lactamase induction signal transducer AmpG